jgi:hypothetical protein
MNHVLLLLPLLLVVSVPVVYAEVGPNYDTITNDDGTITWSNAPERILVGNSWQNYFISIDTQKVIFNSNNIGGLTYDISSCSYSLYENGYSGNQIIPSVSLVGTVNDGEWKHLTVNDELCLVDVVENEKGIILTSTKTIIESQNFPIFTPYTNTVTNSTTGFFTDNFLDVQTQKLKHTLQLDIDLGIKETFEIWDDSGDELGISQTIHVGSEIVIGETVIPIAQYNGQSFDRSFIVDNQAEILQLTDSINYDFDVGIDSLSNVNIIYDDSSTIPYKVNLDYANGNFTNYLYIDPTFTNTGSLSGSNWDFDLSSLSGSIIISSGDIDGTSLTASEITDAQNNIGGTWNTPASGTVHNIHTFTSSGTFAVTGSGNVEYLVVSGGGAGGAGEGAGGGAGGLLTNTGHAVTTQSYPVTVGIGGASSTSTIGANGGNSIFDTITSIGGGAGGATFSTATSTGGSGGSGGGGVYFGGGAGSGISGQGNNGGSTGGSGGSYPSGGGGGASQVGGTPSSNTDATGGYGGNGLQSSITGSTIYYSGGGGGANFGNNLGGAGGLGGGSTGASGIQGTDGLGGGGSGGSNNGGSTVNPTDGGDGVVIIKYNSADFSATGGSLTTQSSASSSPVLSFNYSVGVPPDAPTGLTSTIQDPNNSPLDVFLQWSNPTNVGSGTLTGFEIYRDGILIDTIGLVNSYTDTVTAGSHSFYVKAVSTHGTSIAGNTANITTPTIPGTINDLSGSIISDTKINLSWSAPSNGGSNIDLYKIFKDGSQIDTTTNLTYSATGLTSNTSYTFVIVSNNSVGDSANSNSISKTTYQTVSGSITVTTNTQGATTELTFAPGSIVGTPTPNFNIFTLKEGATVIASGITSPYYLTHNDFTLHNYTVSSTDNSHWSNPTITGTTTNQSDYSPSWNSKNISYNYTRTNGVMDLIVNKDNSQNTWDASCNYRTTSQVMDDQLGITSNHTGVWYVSESQTLADIDTVYVNCKDGEDTLFSFTSFGPNRLGGGIAQLDDFFGGMTGTPVALIFVLLVAGLFTGRTAPTGILVMLALIGVLGFIGLLTLDEAVWGFLLLAGVLGIFLGKRFL